ncbi:sensor domain-containing protein [Oceaniglobus roseus]|uniref:sensor domain-containing protein n=1 Tax=Oceaniglobus roseus TaxID=1737570 RepID=UPI000C7ECF98|nr:EAL domain-containing protein [Kandeliimicrobium roseum]
MTDAQRDQTPEAQRARQDYFATMMRLALSATGVNVTESVETALRHTVEHYGADSAYVYRLHRDGSFRRSAFWFRQGTERQDKVAEVLPARAIARWRDLLDDGVSVHVPPGSELPHPTVGVAFLVPMNGEQGLTGVLGLENVSPAMIDNAEEQSTLGIVAELIQTIMLQLGASNEFDRQEKAVPDDELPDDGRTNQPDFLFELDSEGRFRRAVFADAAAHTRQPEQLLGALLEEVLPPEIVRETRQHMRDIDAHGQILGRVMEVKTSKRNLWYALSGYTAEASAPGGETGYLFLLRDITARIKDEAEMTRLGRIVEMMTNLVVIVDPEQRIVWANKAFENQTGHRLRDIRGLDLGDLLHGEASNRDTIEAVRAAMARGEGFEGENINYSKDGVPDWVTFNMQPLRSADGEITGFVFVETVITERRGLEVALRAERDFLAALTESSVSAIVACDARGGCVFANSEAKALLQPKGRRKFPRADTWPLESIEAQGNSDTGSPFRRVMRSGRPVRNMTVALNRKGLPRRVLSVNAMPLAGVASSARVVITLTDITAQYEEKERKREAAARALYDAEHDQLTGLPNRRHLTRVLQEMFQADPSMKTDLHVMLVDLDKFKSIKTVLGNEVGDDLVRAMADRLGTVASGRAFLARAEADCFILFAQVDGAAADEIAVNIKAATVQPFNLDNFNIFITASVGVTRRTARSETPDHLIRQAEMASFAAKSDGGNRHAHYSPEMERSISRRSAIVQALREALQSDQFELAFQPKYSLEDGYPLCGAEALLRWHSPTLGTIGPGEFIPIAETAGVISDIDFHVVGIFARQLGHWKRQGTAVSASINLSPVSFENPTLAPRLLALLADEGVTPSDVTVEITETSLVSTSQHALENIERFRRAGVSLSIDDFGTGYSSLSYLQRLLVSEVKIDRSFIHSLGSTPEAGKPEAIVRAILMLARSFGLRTVAEGVENMQQLEWLRQEGCHAIQGYIGGKATPPVVYEKSVLAQGSLFAKA